MQLFGETVILDHVANSRSHELWPRVSDERQARQQIDRAVGRALVDHPFAERLLAEPTLAVQDEVCAQRQYLAVGQIQARDLGDFARLISHLFWGQPARNPGPDGPVAV